MKNNEIESKNKRYITITMTEACNLDCTYCYENHKSKNTISSETLKDIVKREMITDNGYDAIEFDLFGGEPFLEFEKIKEIYEYILGLDSNKNFILFATTNGTLVKGEVKEWLKTHPYFICGLSYDGTPEMQDINRSNSSSKIDLNFFKELYPDQEIKMTISKESLKTMADGVIYLHEKGFRVACNLAYNIDWSDEENKNVLQKELTKLIEYYLEHPEIEPCLMLDMSITNVSYAIRDKKKVRYCGAGVSTVAYHIDGTAYPCQFFMPLSVGEEKAKQSLNLKFYDEEIPIEYVEEKCVKCVAQSICPT
ncbi:MAG: 4Fe-4S cluster-binding domain-containing protein, partial [Oscillospiraceae bacterium]|nr:4Fe-4S cluster-binding domain-containing protein [Oscillospiraceae bacterium]